MDELFTTHPGGQLSGQLRFRETGCFVELFYVVNCMKFINYTNGKHHNPQDSQSLLMHREAVRMLEADPTLANKALAILSRWDSHVCTRSKPLRDRWVQIISARDWAMALEESERGNQLRQASPLAILLPHKVRLDIIDSIRRELVRVS